MFRDVLNAAFKSSAVVQARYKKSKLDMPTAFPDVLYNAPVAWWVRVLYLYYA